MQLKLAKNSKTIAIGSKQSPFKGQGLKFKDHQIYSYGDDLRFLDWKLTAKTSVPYVKVFEEEKNQGIDVFIDASRSMAYGHNGISKFEAAIQILCLFYLWSDLSKDKIKTIILSKNVISIPKISGKTGIGYLIQTLIKNKILDDNGNFNIVDTLPINDDSLIEKNMQLLMKTREKKNHLVLISDFYNFINNKSLQYILNDIKALNLIQILSPMDIDCNSKSAFDFQSPFKSLFKFKKFPLSGYFSSDKKMLRNNLFGYKNDISLKIKGNKNSDKYLYKVNIGEKYYLEKFAQGIK